MTHYLMDMLDYFYLYNDNNVKEQAVFLDQDTAQW